MNVKIVVFGERYRCNEKPSVSCRQIVKWKSGRCSCVVKNDSGFRSDGCKGWGARDCIHTVDPVSRQRREWAAAYQRLFYFLFLSLSCGTHSSNGVQNVNVGFATPLNVDAFECSNNIYSVFVSVIFVLCICPLWTKKGGFVRRADLSRTERNSSWLCAVLKQRANTNCLPMFRSSLQCSRIGAYLFHVSFIIQTALKRSFDDCTWKSTSSAHFKLSI